jgi:sulfur relay (sulfurtransferase) DsrF/TusC family protein
MIASLPLYDVERVYILSEDLTTIPEATFDELQITRVNSGELANLIANSRHVLSF